MKKLKRKMHWPTKFISNKNYIKEVSIDGKITDTFNFKTGYYDLYAAQIMRAGNLYHFAKLTSYLFVGKFQEQ